MPYVYNMSDNVTIDFKMRSNGTIKSISSGERYFTSASNAVDVTIKCDSNFVLYAMRSEPDTFKITFSRGSVQSITRSNVKFPADINIFMDLVPVSKIRQIKYLDRNVKVNLYDVVNDIDYEISRVSDYVPESEFNYIITSNSGFDIQNVSTYLDGEYLEFEVSADNKTATLKNVILTANIDLDIVTVEEPTTPKHSVTYDNRYVLVYFDGKMLKNNQPNILEEKSYNVLIDDVEEGYMLESVGGYLDGEYLEIPISEDGLTAETILFLNGDLELNIVTKEVSPPIIYHEITISNVNVTVSINNNPLSLGVNEFEEGTYKVEVNANEGFEIVSAGGYLYGDFISFDVSYDKLYASKTFLLNSDFDLDIVTKVKQPPQDVTGFNHLYLVDGELLKNLAGERFGRGGEDFGVVTDLGDFIINVVEIPFPITDEIKGLETPIMLGYELITTTAVELLTDTMTISIGKIDVPHTYNNSYDFLNTEIILHLPFSNSIQLDVNYVIGQSILIDYVIDLYSGDATVNIKSSKIDGELFYNESFKLGKPIPFIRKGDAKIFGDINANLIQNRLYTAFIEVIRNAPYEVDSIFNSDTSIRTKLINESGVLSVDNIVLNTSATSEEQNMILSILRSGVFIK